MRQQAGGRASSSKRRSRVGIGGKAGGQRLDRDVAAEARIARAIHLAHPAGADEPEDLVGSGSSPLPRHPRLQLQRARETPHDEKLPARSATVPDAWADERRIVEDVNHFRTNCQPRRHRWAGSSARRCPSSCAAASVRARHARRIAERECRRGAPRRRIQPADAPARGIVVHSSGEARIDPRHDIGPLPTAKQPRVVAVLQDREGEAALIEAHCAHGPSAKDRVQHAAASEPSPARTERQFDGPAEVQPMRSVEQRIAELPIQVELSMGARWASATTHCPRRTGCPGAR